MVRLIQPLLRKLSTASLRSTLKDKNFQNILIVKKKFNDQTAEAELELIKHLKENYKQVHVILEKDSIRKLPETDYYLADSIQEYERVVDLIITLGGDGTLLHASSLFPRKVAPILSFSMGSLGYNNYKPVIKSVIKDGQIPVLERMKLSCTLIDEITGRKTESSFQVMNEVAIHRGRNTQMGKLDVFIGDNHLTDVVADGLIISTPTGSTAYSLSAGGPIVHPFVSSMLLTPICPRSLSFRPLVLPSTFAIKMKLSPEARDAADISVDGHSEFSLSRNQVLIVEKSKFSIPCIQPGSSDWLNSITKSLRWNQTFVNGRNLLD